MLDQTLQISNPFQKIDNYQSNSILSTSSDQYPCKAQSLQITPVMPEFPKKVKKLPVCYPCDTEDCTMLFDKMEECENHKKTHENLNKCSFPGCNKQFIQFINLKKHFKHHFPSKKLYLCPFPGCHKSFTASYNLTIHYRIHKGDMPYECEICAKKFFDRANYKYHTMVRHTEIKLKDRTCQHKGCCHKSKTKKQKLMHHNKLEIECKNEKNHLFNLLNHFRCSINDLVEIKNDLFEEINKFERDDEMKGEILNIQRQAKILIDIAVDKDQYKGILDNC